MTKKNKKQLQEGEFCEIFSHSENRWRKFYDVKFLLVCLKR
jgi:hypothetical protein